MAKIAVTTVLLHSAVVNESGNIPMLIEKPVISSDKPKNNKIIVERPSTATSIIKAIIPSTISACGKFCIIKSIQTSLGVNLYFACLNY